MPSTIRMQVTWLPSRVDQRAVASESSTASPR